MLINESLRIELHLLTPTHLHELFEKNEESFLMEYLGVNEAGLSLYKSFHVNGMESHRNSLRMLRIVLKETNSVIGECGFHTWNTFHRNAELYYRLNDDVHKNKGYMSEILPAILSFGFKEMSLHRIEAKIGEENIPSLKLLLKNGFKIEGRHIQDYLVDGEFEDSIIYALLESEYKS